MTDADREREQVLSLGRAAYAEEWRPGLPRWRYFDRDFVGALLAKLDAVTAERDQLAAVVVEQAKEE